MLNIFRKHASSWLIKVALFLIVIVFIFWGGYSYTERDASRLARVNDEYITISEFDKSYSQMLEMYRRQLGNSFSEEMIRQLNLKQQAFNMLIDRYLVSEAAKDLGLTASEQEMQQRILEYPVFQTDGTFDRERYVLVLRQNRLSPELFEQQMRDDLSLQNVENFVKRQAAVTDDEILAQFRFNQSPIQVSYAEVTPKSFVDRVTTSDKVLRDYFEKNKDKYKEPEKRKFSMVLFMTEPYMKDVQVSAEEIAEYYNENQPEYHKDAEVKARHILFRVEESAPEEEAAKVKAEAQKVLGEAKGKGADFAELVKKYSQAPDAQEGGDLGYFTRDRMVPAFAEAAFALKTGEISEVVRTPYGFHIIKVEDVRPERTVSLEEARAEIELNLKRQKARDIAYDKARDFADLAYADGDLKKAAQQEKLPVTETKDWLPQVSQLPGVPASPQVMEDLFSLPEKGISSVLEGEQGYLVARVDGIKAPEIPPFDEAKVKIELGYRNEQAQELAQKAAADLLAEAKKVNSLEQAGKEKQVEVKKSDWFSRAQPDRALMVGGDALNKLFRLEETDPFPEAPLDVAKQFFLVYQLLGKKPAPKEQLEKERPTILQTLQTQKQNQLWQAWLEQQRSKADIEIFKEL